MTIDAAGCRKESARQIADAGGDCLLAVKGDQGALHEAVARAFAADVSGTPGGGTHREEVFFTTDASPAAAWIIGLCCRR